jgi:alpha-acetolactate decarboxylase
MMRKSIVVFVIMLLPTFFFGQAAFDKFDGQDDVTSIIVNKKMFQMMVSFKTDNKDKDNQQYLDLIKKLDNLKVFTTNSTRVSAEMKTTSEKYMKSAGLEELMRVNDNGKNIKISVRSGAKDSQIKELLMFMEGSSKGNQTVLMSLTGDFDLNEISVLTDKMRIPGGDELKKATKGKK